MKQLWLIYFESANYCGYGDFCVVEAESAKLAEEIAEPFAEACYYEQDCAQYYEDNGVDFGPAAWAEIMRCEPFDESHECWKYYLDPDQSQFSPKVNF